MKQAHIGSNFDDFLQQDGLLAECEAVALKRTATRQIEQEMKHCPISRPTQALSRKHKVDKTEGCACR